MSITEHPPSGFWKRNLDKIGHGGSIFGALCCLGFPALLSIVSAISRSRNFFRSPPGMAAIATFTAAS